MILASSLVGDITGWRKVMTENEWSLRDLYRSLDLPGKNPLRDAHQQLDAAVRAAYGMKATDSTTTTSTSMTAMSPPNLVSATAPLSRSKCAPSSG